MEYNVIRLDDRYLIGIESIDEQHKQLISMCNNLYLNSRKEDNISQNFFRSGVSGLVSFLQYHFFVEEQLLSRINYPEFQAHREEHRKGVDFITPYLMRLGTNDELHLKALIPEIRRKILQHITVSDRRYANYIHALNRYTPWHLKDSYLPPELFLG
jgi:hemerythrin